MTGCEYRKASRPLPSAAITEGTEPHFPHQRYYSIYDKMIKQSKVDNYSILIPFVQQ